MAKDHQHENEGEQSRDTSANHLEVSSREGRQRPKVSERSLKADGR
jgi:hypothetical protein